MVNFTVVRKGIRRNKRVSLKAYGRTRVVKTDERPSCGSSFDDKIRGIIEFRQGLKGSGAIHYDDSLFRISHLMTKHKKNWDFESDALEDNIFVFIQRLWKTIENPISAAPILTLDRYR